MRILLLWTCAGADFGWQQFSSSRYFEIGLVSASPPFSLKGATSIYYYILLREKGERYNSGNLFPYCTVILLLGRQQRNILLLVVSQTLIYRYIYLENALGF